MLNTYYFQGIRWIPSYRDFDYDDCKIVAETVENALKKLDEQTMLKTWKSLNLISINNEIYHENM